MAFNVNQFRSEMIGDGARPNLFQVEMAFPVFSAPGNAQRKLTFMCKTASLPGSTVNSVTANYFGRELKFAGNRTFADWSVTIINDEDFAIRKAFERWLGGLNSHLPNLRTPAGLAPVSYQVDATVTQFGKTGNELKKYKLIGVFPTDLAAIDLDWGSNDSIEEYSVSLSYQWWEDVANAVI